MYMSQVGIIRDLEEVTFNIFLITLTTLRQNHSYLKAKEQSNAKQALSVLQWLFLVAYWQILDSYINFSCISANFLNYFLFSH